MERFSLLTTAFLFLMGCTSAPAPAPVTAPTPSPAVASVDIVQVNPQYAGPYEILERKLTAEEAYYVFRGESGIFSFDLKPLPLTLGKVTFVLKDQGKLDNLSIMPEGGRWYQLFYGGQKTPPGDKTYPGHDEAPGVKVTRNGRDWTAVFTGPGIEALRKGGRFQIIDYYRR